MNEFKFFKGKYEINNNLPLFVTANGINYNNFGGEIANAAFDLQERIARLEREINYMNDRMREIIVGNETNNL